MARPRKTIGVDRDLVEKVASIARRRGMTLSEYLRRLLSSSIALEEMGLFAPKVLEDMRNELLVSSFKFVLVPQELLIGKRFEREDYERAREYGERIGRALHEMSLDADSLIERIGGMTGVVIKRSSDMVVIKSGDFRGVLSELVIGIARGNGYEVAESGDIAVIRPREKRSGI